MCRLFFPYQDCLFSLVSATSWVGEDGIDCLVNPTDFGLLIQMCEIRVINLFMA